MTTVQVTNKRAVSGGAVIDAGKVRTLYFSDTTKGSKNRKLLKATVPTRVANSFRQFLATYTTGGKIQRGSGIGSPMIAIAIKLLMAVIAGQFKDDVMNDLKIIALPGGVATMSDNLEELAADIVQ